MNKKKTKKIYNYILIIFLILSSTILFNNKTIEKEKTNNLKALDQEGQNYRLVTSADNVQVPVPKGYVASQVTGENYVTPEYSHTTITNKISTTPTVLTWSSPAGEQYPWTQDENGIWISGNQGIPNSESVLESEEFDYVKGTTLTINYTYSCEWNWDYFYIDLIYVTNNTTQRIVNTYGNTYDTFVYTTSNYTWATNTGKTGRYKIKATLSKGGAGDGGQDSGYIKASTYFKEDENGETIEIDQKTRIHDGGFVIYQLTDAELETDPNGTSVIINDANKDEAQITRNQYVWVPVQNIEDIIRTREIYNGIMQFGQSYTFTNTSITKVTDTETDYYREPRLEDRYDKTKYYLQRYSDIDKREDYLNKMQEEYKRMIKSINKYKGFYIGRYETGDDYTHNSSKNCFINPRVVRYNNNIDYITWFDSYRDLERLSGKTEQYVETGMLYDSLWDYTLKWIKETNTKSYEEIGGDSGTWGNYKNNYLKYKTSANGTESIKEVGSNTRISTGGITEIIYEGETYNNSPTASNNIFDLAGNIYECTRSRANDFIRKIRGGGCGLDSDSRPVCNASGVNAFNSYYDFGVRSELLIR